MSTSGQFTIIEKKYQMGTKTMCKKIKPLITGIWVFPHHAFQLKDFKDTFPRHHIYIIYESIYLFFTQNNKLENRSFCFIRNILSPFRHLSTIIIHVMELLFIIQLNCIDE